MKRCALSSLIKNFSAKSENANRYTRPTIEVRIMNGHKALCYRIYKKVVGVDADFVFVECREDLDYLIEGLPANAQIEIAVSAVNNGGESANAQR